MTRCGASKNLGQRIDFDLVTGIVWMRGKVLAWVAGSDSRHLLIYEENDLEHICGRDYRLFQLADLVCTVNLIECRLEKGEPMTLSEFKFFGSPRDFKRNVLRKLKPKEI